MRACHAVEGRAAAENDERRAHSSLGRRAVRLAERRRGAAGNAERVGLRVRQVYLGRGRRCPSLSLPHCLCASRQDDSFRLLCWPVQASGVLIHPTKLNIQKLLAAWHMFCCRTRETARGTRIQTGALTYSSCTSEAKQYIPAVELASSKHLAVRSRNVAPLILCRVTSRRTKGAGSCWLGTRAQTFVLGAWDAQQCFKARCCACTITVDVDRGGDQKAGTRSCACTCLHVLHAHSARVGWAFCWFYNDAVLRGIKGMQRSLHL